MKGVVRLHPYSLQRMQDLKSQVLFLDEVVFLDHDWLLRGSPYREDDERAAVLAESEYLLERGVARTIDNAYVAKRIEESRGAYRYATDDGPFGASIRATSLVSRRLMNGPRGTPQYAYDIELLRSLRTRVVAAFFQDIEGKSAISLEPFPIAPGKDCNVEVASVLQVVVPRIPTLFPDLPWEEVIDLMQDAELKLLVKLLRRRVSELYQANMKNDDVVDAIYTATREYAMFMLAVGVKYHASPFQFTVINAAEAIEDILRLRAGGIARKGFALRQAQAEVILAEQCAPGRELSIIPYPPERLE